ncbi:Lacal_2735 family protein [uncultured Nonlabens sp.]|uniref:Lacal_2735 family protein n=1 Tax=uncultured Nonlabens sp. TaxID=859306 RepID=UPI00260D202D|nr:Lacal_2735 family protein [uncultured Nonlabens sp.]
MKKDFNSYENDLTDLRRLEKRYSCLMKQAFEAGINDRNYSDQLNQMALKIKEEIKLLRSHLEMH